MLYVISRLGESCSHIGALLFKIEAAVRLGYTHTACTDVACQWNNDFVKKIEGKEVKDIKFYQVKAVKNPITRKFTDATETEQNKLLNCLKQLPPTQYPVGLSLFKDCSKPFHHKNPIPCKPKIPNSLREYHQTNLTEDEITERIKEIHEIKISHDQINFIENATKQQSASLIWKDVRVGRITASVAFNVLHTNMEKPSESLIAKICTPGVQLNVPAIKWGQENESVALKAYEAILKMQHSEVKISKSGLRLHKEYHFLGASADAVGYCKCHGEFLIELKCPYKHKDKTSLQQCVENDNIFLYAQ